MYTLDETTGEYQEYQSENYNVDTVFEYIRYEMDLNLTGMEKLPTGFVELMIHTSSSGIPCGSGIKYVDNSYIAKYELEQS